MKWLLCPRVYHIRMLGPSTFKLLPTDNKQHNWICFSHGTALPPLGSPNRDPQLKQYLCKCTSYWEYLDQLIEDNKCNSLLQEINVECFHSLGYFSNNDLSDFLHHQDYWVLCTETGWPAVVLHRSHQFWGHCKCQYLQCQILDIEIVDTHSTLFALHLICWQYVEH